MPAQALVGLLWEGIRGGGGGGLFCCVFFNVVVKGELEFILMFVLLSLHWKHKFEIDRNTLFELTLILHVSFNLRTIQYMGEAKIIL